LDGAATPWTGRLELKDACTCGFHPVVNVEDGLITAFTKDAPTLREGPWGGLVPLEADRGAVVQEANEQFIETARDLAATAQAEERLRGVLPHLKIAMHMAKLQVPNGTVKLAIVAKEPDGSGRITSTFEGEEFLRDLETLVGDPDMEDVSS
jgi:hypothetical protein